MNTKGETISGGAEFHQEETLPITPPEYEGDGDIEANLGEVIDAVGQQTESINLQIDQRNQMALMVLFHLGLATLQTSVEDGEVSFSINQENFANQWLANNKTGSELRARLQDLFDGMNQTDIGEILLLARCTSDFSELVAKSIEKFIDSDESKDRKKIRKRAKKAIKKLLE